MRMQIGRGLSPWQAVLALRHDPLPVALIGRWGGGGAILASSPIAIARPETDPFALLDSMPECSRAPDGVVGGGWFGYLGYRLGARLERLPPGPGRPAPLPESHLAFYDHLLRHDENGWWFEALVSEEEEAWLTRRAEQLASVVTASPPCLNEYSLALGDQVPAPPAHAEAVARVIDQIREGELFQANICMRQELELRGELIDLFADVGSRLEPDYAAYLGEGSWSVASMSPELYLRRSGNVALSSPIKGTAARLGRPETDRTAASALAASPKDLAEHVMIVDLVRNDLGRVCKPGSVQVVAMCEPRAHPGVWHLVSDIRGELESGVGNGDLVRATFPPGSVTGAPKVAAMGEIAALEATSREVYTGAIGYASPLGGLELNVAIRTFERCGDKTWVGVGGGIVADSDPWAEVGECSTKLVPLVEGAIAQAAAEREVAP